MKDANTTKIIFSKVYYKRLFVAGVSLLQSMDLNTQYFWIFF